MPTDINLGLKIITIVVRDDDTTSFDLGGVDPWAAYSLLYAITNELWEGLPAPTREKEL